MKKCPHCSSKAVLREEFDFTTDGTHIWRSRHLSVECTSCGASTKKIRVDTFSEFSNYAAYDFRLDPDLRAKEEEIYAAHENSLRKDIVNLWDKRSEK
jgi:hypothetical protein